MILVDDRAGSRELLPYLGDLAIPTRLEFGDACFHGNGPGGDITVGVEVKKIDDLLSSMGTGRLAGHQIPGLVLHYGEPWLLVVGNYRPGRGGRLETHYGKSWKSHRNGGRDLPYAYLEAFLVECQTMGIRVKQVYNNEEAACWLACLYKWWSKPWADHRGMRKFDQSANRSLMPNCDPDKEAVARVAKELPGIGWERAWAVANVFPDVLTMCQSPESAWLEVEGVGKVLARSAYRFIRGI